MLSLHTRTWELLKSSDKTILEVHKESGLPFYWLRKFSLGLMKDPSVNKVQALYEFLSNEHLTLK